MPFAVYIKHKIFYLKNCSNNETGLEKQSNTPTDQYYKELFIYFVLIAGFLIYILQICIN